ncbi:MAG: hypothetical protein ABIN01_08390 [Ferruginibacter sp.]
MKRVISVALLILSVQLSNAQDGGDRVFKKFKTDVSLGYAIPEGSGTKGGVLFVIEPKFAIIDKLSVGLRMEAAGLANVDLAGETGTVRILSSYLATSDYYFTTNKFRPFVGAGAGIFTMASYDIEGSTQEVPSTSDFGFMTRAGFEAGHFRLGGEYNFLKNKGGYIGIKVGVCIGGGEK